MNNTRSGTRMMYFLVCMEILVGFDVKRTGVRLGTDYHLGTGLLVGYGGLSLENIQKCPNLSDIGIRLR